MENDGRSKGHNIDMCVDTNEVETDHGEQNLDYSFGTYNPQVSSDIKPIKGQEFQTLDDVLNFYNAYANAAGFSVRNYSTKKRKGTGEIIRKEFVCYKQGKSERFADVDKKRRRGILKEGCNAKLVVVKSKISSFVVSIFIEGHNHLLSTPRKTHLLRSHRQVSVAAKCLTQQLSMVNIPPHQQYSLLQVQSGGVENVGFTQKDLYNYERDMRMEVKGHDGDMLLEYFKLEQAKNPSFVFKIDADDEQKITRCFWADATMRRAYKFYGDVVIFDTTYNTNRYGLIFAPFMGVNNHGQTVIFACAFLNKELIDSFVWLFNNFLKVMPGDAPKMIITDQDPAMTTAIPLALPTTFHRYCSWHILSKFSEKIDAAKYTIYYKEFPDCIWNSESGEEFDMKWMGLVEKSGLKENKWLNDMYEIRSKWIPGYVNHTFSANMSSSQRAESSHSFFKKFVSKGDSLVDFMIQFGRGLVKQRHEELIADNKDMIEKPKMKMNHGFLVHMVDLYTREIYYVFQDEMWEILNYKFRLLREIENQQVFSIQRMSAETSRVREIRYDKHLDYASCSCRKFESYGIPCRHILAYLIKFHDLSKLPEQYILKRWTKEAKVGTVIDDGGLLVNDDKLYIIKRGQLVKASLDVVDKALISEEATKIFKDGLENIREKINALGGCATSARVFSEKINPIGDHATSGIASGNYEHIYNEPNQVRAKGCGKRLKGGKEKALVKAKKHKVRRCHGCGKVGQAHDKRNCPSLVNQSSSCNKDTNLSEKNGSSSEDEKEIDIDSED